MACRRRLFACKSGITGCEKFLLNLGRGLRERGMGIECDAEPDSRIFKEEKAQLARGVRSIWGAELRRMATGNKPIAHADNR